MFQKLFPQNIGQQMLPWLIPKVFQILTTPSVGDEGILLVTAFMQVRIPTSHHYVLIMTLNCVSKKGQLKQVIKKAKIIGKISFV